MKTVMTIVFGAFIGMLGTIFTITWQEENLHFHLSDTAVFGDIAYQNLRIMNDGWEPAENVRISVSRKEIGPESVKASTSFHQTFSNGRFLGTVDRIRRGEAVTVSFAFEGHPLSSSDVVIKSDRSIAEVELPNSGGWLDWFSFFVGATSLFLVSMAAGIMIPAYRDYVKRAQEHQERMSE